MTAHFAELDAGQTVYIASKTKHAWRWRELRENGYPVISTWIDESGAGETSDFADLWLRCVHEASHCDALILYREPDEILKGAWVEAGAALACGIPVFSVGCEAFSFVNHPGVSTHSSIYAAISAIRAALSVQP